MQREASRAMEECKVAADGQHATAAGKESSPASVALEEEERSEERRMGRRLADRRDARRIALAGPRARGQTRRW